MIEAKRMLIRMKSLRLEGFQLIYVVPPPSEDPNIYHGEKWKDDQIITYTLCYHFPNCAAPTTEPFNVTFMEWAQVCEDFNLWESSKIRKL